MTDGIVFTKVVEMHMPGEGYVEFNYAKVELTLEEVKSILHLSEVLRREDAAFIHRYTHLPTLLDFDQKNVVDDRRIDCVQLVVSLTDFWYKGRWCERLWDTESISLEILQVVDIPDEDLPKYLTHTWHDREATAMYKTRLAG